MHSYIEILAGLKEKIRQAKVKAAFTVNSQLLIIYWEIGKTISEQEKMQGWGAKTVDILARDLKIEFPDMKGLSLRNLRYMRDFAEVYPHFLIYEQGAGFQIPDSFLQQDAAKFPYLKQMPDIEQLIFLQQVAAKLPWGHHQVILDKLKTQEERWFYIQKTVQNGWSRSVLVQQITSKLFQRQGNAITNFENTLPQPQSDLAIETLKNPYIFDFLAFGERIQERELEKALIQHLKSFMLELGRGFAYVGNQFNIVVENDDFFLDLLFYNFHLQCFVIFELKVGEFKPEFAGKLNFYINTVDEQIKGKENKPTIGVLLCKTPNETVVKYALKGVAAPIGVADYELVQSLPKQLKGEIPSIQELEAEIEKEYEELKSPADKKLDAIKKKLANVKNEEITEPATYETLVKLYQTGMRPLYKELLLKLKSLEDLFITSKPYWYSSAKTFETIEEAEKVWIDETYLRANTDLNFGFRYYGFKKGWPNPFDVSFELRLIMRPYWYEFLLINFNNNEPVFKKPFPQELNKNDRNDIIEKIYGYVVDEIERNVDRIILE